MSSDKPSATSKFIRLHFHPSVRSKSSKLERALAGDTITAARQPVYQESRRTMPPNNSVAGHVTIMKLISVSNVVSLIAHEGLERIILMMADYIKRDFARWPEFEKAARYASHSADGVIELMPTADAAAFAFKYVNGHPKNFERGLQTVAALGILADVATGYPELIAEMTIMTAVRTAAMSALAASFLARPDSRSMALIGLGAQSEFQAIAFRCVTGISQVKVFDPDPAAVRKFLANMRDSQLDIIVAGSAGDATAGADIVTTVTADKRHATILGDNHVGAGMHINAVGGDCPGKTELAEEVLKRARIFVEFEPQTRIEGEIQKLPPDAPVTELWKVFAGSARGRRSADEITIFDSVGFAVEDFSALRLLRDLTADGQFCSEVELIPTLSDTKDLFGLLSGGPGLDLAA